MFLTTDKSLTTPSEWLDGLKHALDDYRETVSCFTSFPDGKFDEAVVKESVERKRKQMLGVAPDDKELKLQLMLAPRSVTCSVLEDLFFQRYHEFDEDDLIDYAKRLEKHTINIESTDYMFSFLDATNYLEAVEELEKYRLKLKDARGWRETKKLRKKADKFIVNESILLSIS